MSDHNIKFGTDLITFYAPSFWGGRGGLNQLRKTIADGGWDPPRFWERILDSAQAAGMDGIEITFPPGDWRSALQAFGSPSAFNAALHDRGLELAAGFFCEITPDGQRLNFLDPADHDAIVELAGGYAEFLSACNAEVLVTAFPSRKSRDADPPLFFDLRLAEFLAGLLNRMGAAALRHGVKLAMHPEAFSLFRNSRDVDLVMTLTDPTYVFLCPDTAQFVVAGSDPVRVVDRHRERVALTHWKDAVGSAPADTVIDETIFERQIEWFTGVGDGVVDWPAWMRLMRDMRYQGWALFELDTAADPIAELQRNRRFVEKALGHIYR